MCKKLITVFTPAYNRAYSLPRTYESLRGQECKNFLWLIVDDGSTDNTAGLVQQWQQTETEFEIRYIFKENGGMHTAHNTAYENIDTELNICIDSDDALAPHAIAQITEAWQHMKSADYAGIIGLDSDFQGNVLGVNLPKDTVSTTLQRFLSSGGSGDKKLVLRTDVVREFPAYPVFPGEKFVPLGSLYAMIDQKYELLILNEILCLVEYMPDGSTKNMFSQYFRNPNGFRYSRLVSLSGNISSKRKFVLYIHYVAESLLAKKKIFTDAPQKLPALLAFPFGLLLWQYILLKNRS